MLGTGCLKSCLGRVAFVVVLVGGSYAAWRWGGEAAPRVRGWLQEASDAAEPVASPELAQSTLDRFAALRDGSGPDRMALGDTELTSVLKYALAGMIPEQVAEPSVTLVDGGLTLSGKVPVEVLEGLAELGTAIGFLPDTLLLELEGSLAPLDNRSASLVIHRVIAGHIPLPDRMIAGVLQALGRDAQGGVSSDLLTVPLPSGVESAYILRDSLVLVAER